MQIVSLTELYANSEIIAEVKLNRPAIIGIDAPLSLPQGLCCLEKECSCASSSNVKGRRCERELARIGIGCYFTTKRSIIRQMIYRALELKKDITMMDCDVIEVYPYATKVRLWGKPIPKKNTSEGLRFLYDRLIKIFPDLSRYSEKLTHDLYDALIAAYTAYLHYNRKTDLIGDLEEGIVAIPSGDSI